MNLAASLSNSHSTQTCKAFAIKGEKWNCEANNLRALQDKILLIH